MRFAQVLFFLSFSIVSLFAQSSHAYLSLLESGELTPSGVSQVGLSPQFLLSNGGGTNMSAYLDRSLHESVSMRASLGTGNTDLWAGLSLKWMPIPDFKEQPAIGLRTGFNIVRKNDESLFVVQLTPLVSKKYEVEAGQIVPFAGLNTNIENSKKNDSTSFQLIAGAEYNNPNWNSVKVAAELGMNMSKSFTYFATSVSIPIDMLYSGKGSN